MPTVSVIVPVYNVEQYLPRCIDSILRQSFTDYELILVDDGSSDNCGMICDEYAKRDKRIHVIHQQNMGVSAARNTGLDNANGYWIAFVDSDDWIHKDYLMILLSGALTDTEIVICGCKQTNNEEEIDKEFHSVKFRNASLNEIQKDHFARSRVWGRIIRRETIGNNRFITGSEPAEDSCFNELLYSENIRFRVSDTELYYYYMRDDSAIHSHLGRLFFNTIDLLLDCLNDIKEQSKRSRIIMRCYKYVFSARYGERYCDDYLEVKKSCKTYFNKLSKYLSELSRRERMIMLTFQKSPSLYRLWRIINDPTLLHFEKKQRELKKMRHIDSQHI